MKVLAAFDLDVRILLCEVATSHELQRPIRQRGIYFGRVPTFADRFADSPAFGKAREPPRSDSPHDLPF